MQKPPSKCRGNLFKKGLEIIPELANHTVTATYAGIRPASEFKDYQIQAHDQQSYISVGGIRSTGLSAAPGIARHVYGLYEKMGRRHEELDNQRRAIAGAGQVIGFDRLWTSRNTGKNSRTRNRCA